MTKYENFIEAKSQIGGMHGFKPTFIPDKLFDFQKDLIDWAVRKGKAAIFADCGLGKTFLELVFAQNVVEKTNGNVLILAPLAVTGQTADEAEKFGIEAKVSRDGQPQSKITIANYDRLDKFNWQDYECIIADESGCMKNFDGIWSQKIIDFMRKLKYRLLCTATPCPNDCIELGMSSEALGELGYIDMLKTFFKAANDTYAQGGGNKFGQPWKQIFSGKFRFRGHAEQEFWRWICSWARAIRKPSDLGFEDGNFSLPKLIQNQHVVTRNTPLDGWLIQLPVHGLKEERSERRQTITERCELAAKLSSQHEASVAWCNLNPEGDLLEKLIPDCVQVKGSQGIDEKEELLEAFRLRKPGAKRLVSKSEICGFGLNLQFCNHMTYFPSHSFEQLYQAKRRMWRFGQKRECVFDLVTSEGELDVLKNLNRKEANSEKMFEQLVSLMRNELKIETKNHYTKKEKLPVW